jgi:hypothetical protein
MSKRDRTAGMSFEEFHAGLDKRRGDPPCRSPYGVPGVNTAEDAAEILAGMGRGPRTVQEVTPAVKPAPAPADVAATVAKAPPRKRETLREKLARLRGSKK